MLTRSFRMDKETTEYYEICTKNDACGTDVLYDTLNDAIEDCNRYNTFAKLYEYSDTALQYIVMHKVENIIYDKDKAVSEYTVIAKRVY